MGNLQTAYRVLSSGSSRRQLGARAPALYGMQPELCTAIRAEHEPRRLQQGRYRIESHQCPGVWKQRSKRCSRKDKNRFPGVQETWKLQLPGDRVGVRKFDKVNRECRHVRKCLLDMAEDEPSTPGS